jgi:hypothetical protein
VLDACIRKAQHTITVGFKVPRPRGVAIGLLLMHRIIQFDDQSVLRAAEIGDESLQRVLAAELQAAQLALQPAWVRGAGPWRVVRAREWCRECGRWFCCDFGGGGCQRTACGEANKRMVTDAGRIRFYPLIRLRVR